MTQTDLFDSARPMYRRSDPVTSQEAALSALDLRDKHHSMILAVMRLNDRPMACQEISDALGWPTHHAANRRTVELERAGKIAVVEGDFYTNVSGRRARRYRVMG
jgi:hypothetical protein